MPSHQKKTKAKRRLKANQLRAPEFRVKSWSFDSKATQAKKYIQKKQDSLRNKHTLPRDVLQQANEAVTLLEDYLALKEILKTQSEKVELQMFLNAVARRYGGPGPLSALATARLPVTNPGLFRQLNPLLRYLEDQQRKLDRQNRSADVISKAAQIAYGPKSVLGDDGKKDYRATRTTRREELTKLQQCTQILTQRRRAQKRLEELQKFNDGWKAYVSQSVIDEMPQAPLTNWKLSPHLNHQTRTVIEENERQIVHLKFNIFNLTKQFRDNTCGDDPDAVKAGHEVRREMQVLKPVREGASEVCRSDTLKQLKAKKDALISTVGNTSNQIYGLPVDQYYDLLFEALSHYETLKRHSCEDATWVESLFRMFGLDLQCVTNKSDARDACRNALERALARVDKEAVALKEGYNERGMKALRMALLFALVLLKMAKAKKVELMKDKHRDGSPFTHQSLMCNLEKTLGFERKSCPSRPMSRTPSRTPSSQSLSTSPSGSRRSLSRTLSASSIRSLSSLPSSASSLDFDDEVGRLLRRQSFDSEVEAEYDELERQQITGGRSRASSTSLNVSI